MKARYKRLAAAYDDEDDGSFHQSKPYKDERAKRQNLRLIGSVIAIAIIITGAYWNKLGPILWKFFPTPDFGIAASTPTPTPAAIVYVPPSPTPIPEPTPIRPTWRVHCFYNKTSSQSDGYIPISSYDFKTVDNELDESALTTYGGGGSSPIERFPASLAKRFAIVIGFGKSWYALAVPLVVKWYTPNGRPIKECNKTLYLRKDYDWNAYLYASQCGSYTPGQWIPGKYKVEMWEYDTLVAQKELEIYTDTTQVDDIPDGPFKNAQRDVITIPKGRAHQTQPAPTPCTNWRDCLRESKKEAAVSSN